MGDRVAVELVTRSLRTLYDSLRPLVSMFPWEALWHDLVQAVVSRLAVHLTPCPCLLLAPFWSKLTVSHRAGCVSELKLRGSRVRILVHLVSASLQATPHGPRGGTSSPLGNLWSRRAEHECRARMYSTLQQVHCRSRVRTHRQPSARVHHVERKDPHVHPLQPRLALAHHIPRDEVHALLVVGEAAGVSGG